MRMFFRIPWLLILLLLVGAAWSVRPLSDTDLLWHLRTGQWMIEHGDVVRQDVFSATRLDCNWVSVPWLYEGMLAKLHAAWGWLGPTLWQILMVCAVTLQATILMALLRRRPGSRLGDARKQAEGVSCVVEGRLSVLEAGWDWRWPRLSVPAALVTLLLLRLAQMRINGRPEWNSYLLIGTFLILLTLATRAWRGHAGPAAGRRLVWLLPVLQVVWTNSHGIFLLGPVLACLFAAAAWLEYAVERALASRAIPLDPDGLAPETEGDWPRPRAPSAPVSLTLVAGATLLACLVTPYGLAGTLYPLHLLSILNDPLYANAISEGRPVDLSMVLDSGKLGYALLIGWTLALLGLLGRLLEGTRNRGLWHTVAGDLGLGYLGACAGLAWLSLTAIRNVPLLPLVAAPLMANGIEFAADGLAAVMGRGWARLRGRSASAGASDGVRFLRGRGARLAAGLGVALLLAGVYRAIVSERFYASLGWPVRVAVGFSFHEHPLAACDFLARHRAELPANLTVYGDTRSANCLLAQFGPRWRTYFDGRHAEIYDPPIFRTAIRTRNNPALFQSEARAYGIGLVCFSLSDLREEKSALAPFLYQPSNRWSLVYFDDSAAVFVAESTATASFTERYGLPPPPTNRPAAQRGRFDAWLKRQGRGGASPGMAALDDPANSALDAGPVAHCLVQTLQLGGIWAPQRDFAPMRFCRMASFLDQLGWEVVADDLYTEALADPRAHRLTLPRALRHARRLEKELEDPLLLQEVRERIRRATEALARLDPAHPALKQDAAENTSTNAPAQRRRE